MKLKMYEQGGSRGLYVIRDEESEEYITSHLTKERAEEIVRAVNAHETLIQALYRVEDEYRPVGEVAEIIESALKLAKGE